MAAKPSPDSNRWIHRVLNGTHNHYSCYLPDNLGRLPSFLLKLFYSGIKTDKQQIAVIQQLEDDAVVVYATKSGVTLNIYFITAAIRKTACRIPKSVFITRSISGSRFRVYSR